MRTIDYHQPTRSEILYLYSHKTFSTRVKVMRVQYHGPDASDTFFGKPFYSPGPEKIFEVGEEFRAFTSALNVAFGTGGNAEYWVFPASKE